MRVVVIGGTGPIDSKLVAKLTSAGWWRSLAPIPSGWTNSSAKTSRRRTAPANRDRSARHVLRHRTRGDHAPAQPRSADRRHPLQQVACPAGMSPLGMPLRTETPLDVPVQEILAASTADEGLGPWWVLALRALRNTLLHGSYFEYVKDPGQTRAWWRAAARVMVGRVDGRGFRCCYRPCAAHRLPPSHGGWRGHAASATRARTGGRCPTRTGAAACRGRCV